jgi:hypothetical protein
MEVLNFLDKLAETTMLTVLLLAVIVTIIAYKDK